MLENIMTALGEQNEHDGSDFVGSKVAYRLYWAMMH